MRARRRAHRQRRVRHRDQGHRAAPALRDVQGRGGGDDARAGPRAGPDRITVNAVAPGFILSDTVQANPDITGFQMRRS